MIGHEGDLIQISRETGLSPDSGRDGVVRDDAGEYAISQPHATAVGWDETSHVGEVGDEGDALEIHGFARREVVSRREFDTRYGQDSCEAVI